MNNARQTPDTMPLPALAAALAERCGIPAGQAESFVTAATETIAAALRSDNLVKIKGIGSFTSDSEGNILFDADPAIAAEINAPFSIFEPVEIDGTELLDETPRPDAAEETGDETEPMSIQANAETSLEVELNMPTAGRDDLVPTVETQNVAEPESASTSEPRTDTPEEQPAEEPVEESAKNEDMANDIASTEALPAEDTAPATYPDRAPDSSTAPRTERAEPRVIKVVVREHPWLTGILAGVAGVLIGLVAGYFLYPRLNLNGAPSVEITAGYVNLTQDAAQRESDSGITAGQASPTPEADAPVVAPATERNDTDSATTEEAPKAAAPVVYDTIRGNRYLTTMARQHYGRKIFWVYIYEENKAAISDPDHIAPNTVVVIPPAEKYGIKAGDKLSEQAAERKAVEIVGGKR